MIVVLDTSVLRTDWYLGTNAARLLSDTLYGHEVYVPEVVVREVVNKWRERYDSVRRAADELRQLWPDLREAATPEPDAAVKTFEENYRSLLGERDFTVVPIPDVSHDDLVSRALARSKPFDAKGQDGYRDALIWETIKNVVGATDDRADGYCFLINNPRDFAAADDHRVLHSTLLEEVSHGRDGLSFELHPSFRTFVDAHIAPLDDVAKDVENVLESDAAVLRAISYKLAIAAGRGTDDLGDDSDLRVGAEYYDAELVALDSPIDNVMVIAARATKGETLLTLAAEAAAVFAALVPSEDLDEVTGDPDVTVMGREGAGVRIAVVRPARLFFDAAYDAETRTVTSAELLWATTLPSSRVQSASDVDLTAHEFTVGDVVEHAAFGRGAVVGTEDPGIIVVRFDDGSERKLMAVYAPIEKV